MTTIRLAVLKPFFASFLTCVLAACGGGGGGGGNSGGADGNNGGSSGNQPEPDNVAVSELSDSDTTGNSVSENAEIGREVGITALATDTDDLDVVTYELTGTELFAIDSSSGVVTTAETLDFETNSSHTIQITARSTDGTTSNASFTITVLDDIDPEIGNFSDIDTEANAVSESAAIGTPVGITAQAELNGGEGTLRYSLNDNSLFNIDETTGVVTTAATLDHEEHPSFAESYQVIVVATDGAGRTGFSTYDIEVLDNLPPELQVSFPGPTGFYLGSEISFRGTVSDPENDNVSVVVSSDQNEVRATIDGSTGEWFVEDFSLGDLSTADVTITATDLGTQEATTSSVELILEQIFLRPENIAIDQNNQRAFVADRDAQAIIAVDLQTGARTAFSTAKNDGAPLDALVGMAMDAANNRLIVLEGVHDVLLAVDLTSGNRTIISDGSITSDGVSFINARALTLDGNRALVTDSARDAIFAVDLTSGEQSVVYDGATDALDFGEPISVVVDGDGGAFVLDKRLNTIFAINFDAGTSTVLSDNSSGEIDFAGPRNMVLDTANDRLLVLDGSELSAPDRLLAVNVDNGSRTVVSDNDLHSGPVLSVPVGLAIDSENNRVLVTDIIDRMLLAIDLNNGERTLLSQSPILGSGDRIVIPNSIAWDDEAQRVLLSEELGELYSIDISTGDRDVVSNFLSAGDDLNTPTGIAIFEQGNEVLVVDRTADTVVNVDTITGERAILSDVDQDGVAFNRPVGIALDEDNNRAFVIDEIIDEVFTVNLVDGSRGTISNDDNGTDTAFRRNEDIVFDSANNRVFIVDSGLEALVEVDLITGLRRIVSNDDNGEGVDFEFPTGLDLSSTNGGVIISDPILNALVSVDLTSGDRDIVSDVNNGGGVPYAGAQDIVVDQSHGRAFVLDSGYHLLVVDLESGDRVVISR